MLHYRVSAGEARLLQAELNHQRKDSVALIQADLLDTAKLPSMVEQTVQTFGRLDALVNNAAIPKVRHVTKLSMEDVERTMRKDKLPPRDAAVKAMREVTGPIIAIVLTLTAVFVPIAFLGGLTGELYRQFAVTIAISVIISGLVALTLSPALSALLLRPHEAPNKYFAAFNRWFLRVTARYNDGVVWMLRRGVIAVALFALDRATRRIESNEGPSTVMPF